MAIVEQRERSFSAPYQHHQTTPQHRRHHKLTRTKPNTKPFLPTARTAVAGRSHPLRSADLTVWLAICAGTNQDTRSHDVSYFEFQRPGEVQGRCGVRCGEGVRYHVRAGGRWGRTFRERSKHMSEQGGPLRSCVKAFARPHTRKRGKRLMRKNPSVRKQGREHLSLLDVLLYYYYTQLVYVLSDCLEPQNYYYGIRIVYFSGQRRFSPTHMG